MTRIEEIKEQAKSYAREVCSSPVDIIATEQDFEAGARWADANPRVN